MANSVSYRELPPPKDVIFRTDIDSKIWLYAKRLFKYTIGLLYHAIHTLICKEVCPQAFRDGEKKAMWVENVEGYTSTRHTIIVDGHAIETLIVRKNGADDTAWNIVAGGNDEGIYVHQAFGDLTRQIGGNTIFFGYAGLSSRGRLIKGARAVMRYVEKIGAQKITAIGRSLGGVVIREAYRAHLKHNNRLPNVRYAFVFDRSLTQIADFVRTQLHWILAPAVTFFNWNMGSNALPLEQMGHVITIQDESDNVILPGAWLAKKPTHRTNYAGHNQPVCGIYPEIAKNIRDHFTKN